MKKLATILLMTVFASCSDSEMEYDRKLWIHKTKMLELEYIEKCIKIKSKVDYELITLDSLMIN